MGRSRKSKAPPPTVAPLTPERDNREGVNFFRFVDEDTSLELDRTKRFIIMPGPKGEGWVLKILHDPPTPEDLEPAPQ